MSVTQLTLSEVAADSRVMTERQLRKTLRRFGGAINTGDVDYVDFLMPGIIVQTAVFGAPLTGIGLTEDLKAGVADRFRSLLIARSAVLIGRTAADIVVNTMTLM